MICDNEQILRVVRDYLTIRDGMIAKHSAGLPHSDLRFIDMTNHQADRMERALPQMTFVELTALSELIFTRLATLSRTKVQESPLQVRANETEHGMVKVDKPLPIG
jgi:hypothetical protein